MDTFLYQVKHHTYVKKTTMRFEKSKSKSKFRETTSTAHNYSEFQVIDIRLSQQRSIAYNGNN